jgi:hypothetical protein
MSISEGKSGVMLLNKEGVGGNKTVEWKTKHDVDLKRRDDDFQSF